MTLDPKFLRDVQNSGWLIRFVDQDSVTAACPRQGCSTLLKLRSGTRIPDACGSGADFREVVVGNYETLRAALKLRRQTLGLAIAEVEDIAGVATDHLAKAEKEGPSRVPTLDILAEWAEALGYEIVLRSKPLPAYTLRVISQTRPRLDARLRQFARERQARVEGRR